MIKFNNSDINDWNFDNSNIIKVYHNGAVCYYKITGGGDTPTAQTPCFAVVADISQYSDTEFEDVFNKADDKWYKLNNLGSYEEYGLYGDNITSSATTYQGKLSVYDGYEYIYSGSSWQSVGEVSGSSRVPIGYTEVEYVENTTQAYINTDVYLYDSSSNSYEIQSKFYFQPYGRDFEYLFGTEGTSSPYYGVQLRYYQRNLQYNSSPNNVTWTHINNGDGTSGVTASCVSTNGTNGNNPLTLFCGLWSTGPWRNGRGKIYSFQVTKNNALVRDLVPCTRDSDSIVGLYDIVNDVFYYPPNYQSYQLVAGPIVTGSTEYPIYYDTKQDPPDNLSFSSMTEAQEYECPWWGMSADIDNVDYMFCEGNEWLTKYTYIEVSGEYICDSGDKYKKMQEYDRIPDGTTTATTTYIKGDLIESASTDCQNYFVCLSDIVASSTTSSTDGGYNMYITPDVGTFTKIRIDTTKKTYSASSSWFAFCLTPRGNEVVAINNYTIGETYGWSNKDYKTDANGNQTFAHWVDIDKTIIEIDVNKWSDGQTDTLYLLKYQKNTDLEFLYFNQ